MFESELLVSSSCCFYMFSIRQHMSLKCGKSSGIKVKVAFSKLRKTTWPMTSDFMTLA